MLRAMNEASSIACFRSTRLETFRKNLQAALRQVLLEASSSSNSIGSSYNASALEKSLQESIAWRDLCEHHDNFHYTRKSMECSTPLSEMCHLILVEIPRACTTVTGKQLVHALMQSPHQPNTRASTQNSKLTRWSPSQELILKTIISLLNACPSLSLRHFLSDIDVANFSPTQMNRLVSVTYALAQDCSRLRNDVIQTMLQLIRRLDDKLRVAPPKQETLTCDFCRQHRQQLLRPRKRARYTLSDLHDEDHSHANYFSPRSSITQQPPPKVSLKKVLKTDKTKKATECVCSAASTLTDEKLVTVQSRAYKKLVRLAASHHYPFRILVYSKDKALGSDKQKNQNIPSARIRDWMRLMFHHPTSPSLRLGLLFSVTRNEHQAIAALYWQTYLSTANTLWLRFLSELIACARYFDSPKECWMAVAPLWHHLLSVDGSPGLFGALAYLLATRGPLLRYENEAEFSRLLTRTGLKFGQRQYWKLALPQFAMTLQEYEILGLVELSALDEADDTFLCSSEKKPKNDSTSSTAFSMWPFEEPYTLSSAYLRLNTTNKKDNLCPKEFRDCMSYPTHYRDLLTAASARQAYTTTESAPKSCPPLLHYINGDIQRSVISYLNHVELLRARGVCRYWKSVIDDGGESSMWQQAYSQIFGPYKTESAQVDRDWMSLYRVKYLSEQNLHFQRNPRTAYKHRTCSYLGCLHVLKSEKQQVRHEERHVREQERRRQRQIREDERKQREEEKLFVEYLQQEAKLEEQNSKQQLIAK